MAFALILTILLLAVMELNKNTVTGWLLAAAAFVLYIILMKKFLPERKYRKVFGRLLYTGILAAVFFVSLPPVRPVPASDAKNPEVTETISVEQGELTGVKSADGSVEIFAGIPYAAPPVGELRWKEPQEPEKWDGVRACDTFAPMSMQPRSSHIYDSLSQIVAYHDYTLSLADNYTAPMSEDSLYLNIWRPADMGDEQLPVLVYIHGGSLKTGQPWYADYAGTGLAKQGVIVVNLAYRLGVFGFYGNSDLSAESPDGTTGDYGLLDQIAALKWVQNNISFFGGDSGNVTLAGESAGSACVSALLSSPLASGLFRRAILESSTVDAKIPAHSYRSFEDTLVAGQDLYEETGTSDLEGLRALPAEELVKYTEENHHITPDGYVLPADPYIMYQEGQPLNAEEILNGYNGGESTPFILFDHFTKENFKEKLEGYCGGLVADTGDLTSLYTIENDDDAESAMKEILSAAWFGYGHQCLTEKAMAEGIPVYEYYFNQENGRLGSWHSGEEVYCYANIPEKKHWYENFMGGSRLYTADDRKLSAIMSAYWANFCRTGDPNDDGSGREDPSLPEWKPVTDTGTITEFRADDGTYVREIPVPWKKIYDVLEN